MRRFHARDRPAFTRRQALRIALLAVNNPKARIEPEGLDYDSTPAMRVRLAEAARKELDARKRANGVMTYDDLLTRLHDALSGAGGAAVAARLARRFEVVLVDEFQDTDPVQWEIMQRAFGRGTGTLVLIGDPKQAIYAFRGADVYAYIDAREAAQTHATLAVNWRSDQGLIDAYDALFAGARLGHEGIEYRQVRAADANQTPRLTGAPQCAPLRIRVARRDAPGVGRTPGRLRAQAAGARGDRGRRRRRPRRAAGVPRADRDPRRSRHGPRPRSRWRRATSPCSCARIATARRCATRSTPSASPRSSAARAASSRRPRPANGCASSTRSSARPRRPAHARRR